MRGADPQPGQREDVLTTTIPTRAVHLGALDVSVDHRPDGSALVRAAQTLPAYPDKLTLRLDHWAREAPDRVFLAQRGADGAWRELTYAQTLERVRSLGQAFLDRGLSVTRGVVVLSNNSIEHALLMLAAQYVGVPYAPVSPAYSLVSSDFGKLRHVLGLFPPGLVFADDGHRFERAFRVAVPPDAERVIARNPPDDLGVTRFDDLAATPVTAAVDATHDAVGPDTIAKILFTSGSTGMPKGVINTQRMLCSNQEILAYLFAFLRDEPPVLVDWLPWNHTFGGNHNFGIALNNGGTLYIDEGKPMGSGVDVTVRNLRDVSPTLYFNVPKGYEALLPHLDADPDLCERFFRRVKVMFYAGAGLAPHVWQKLDELAIRAVGERIVMLTGLGATETGPMALNANRQYDQPGRIGLPQPGVVVKLVPSGDKLEARIKSPSVTPGYWRQEELSAKAFDSEGFYCLGDAIRFADPDKIDEGFVFDGRIAEDFKLATGTWVSVGTLRAQVIQHFAPLVEDVVVAGHDRDDIAVLIFPHAASCRELCPHLEPSASLDEVLGDRAVLQRVRALLASLSTASTGSSTRIARAVLLSDPPSLDVGEITDKGSINQRAVLKNRAALVEALYDPAPGPRIITIDG